MDISLGHTILFLTSLYITALWCVFHKHSAHFRTSLILFSCAFGFITSAFISYLAIDQQVSQGNIPLISLFLVTGIITFAHIHGWIPKRQWFFFLCSASFPFLLNTLVFQQFLFGDFFITFFAFLTFFLSAFSLLRDASFRLSKIVFFVAIALLALFRIFANQAATSTDDLSLLFFVSVVLAGGMLFISSPHTKEAVWSTKWQQLLHQRWFAWTIFFFLITVALIHSTTRLGDSNFQNDEYYHVEAAKGFLEVGDFVRWNFLVDRPLENPQGEPIAYTRSAIYTIQTAMSVQLFGFSETAARLPSVFWFLLFIGGSFWVLRAWSKDTLFAFLMTLTFLLSDHFLFHGRIVRMYSMLSVVAGAMMILWFLAYQYSFTEKREKFKLNRFLLLFSGAGFLSLVAVFTHAVSMIFFPAFVVFLCIELLQRYAHLTAHNQPLRRYTDAKTRVAALWALGAFTVVWLGTIAAVFLPSIPSQFVGLRGSIQSSYELLVFSDLPLPLLGMGLYIVGLVHFVRKDIAHRYTAVISLTILVLFVFGVKRYHAYRYILFVVPFFLTIAGDTLYRGLRALSTSITQKNLRPVFVTGVFFLLFIPLSWPGFSEGMLFATSRADRVHENGYGHDFQKAYTYIREHRKADEAVFAQSFRSYYWQNDTVEIIDLGVDNSLSLSRLKKLMKQHKRGWIVWAEGKTHHLRKEVIQFIDRQTENHSEKPELKNSNMRVYSFDWKDMQQ